MGEKRQYENMGREMHRPTGNNQMLENSIG